MSKKESSKVSVSLIDALDGPIRQAIPDTRVASADDLAPVIQADNVILQYGVGLDASQREALAEVAEVLDNARDKHSTIHHRRCGRLVDQHRVEIGRKAAFVRVGELLETAFGTASQARIALRMQANLTWSDFRQEHSWRVIVRAVPANATLQNPAV